MTLPDSSNNSIVAFSVFHWTRTDSKPFFKRNDFPFGNVALRSSVNGIHCALSLQTIKHQSSFGEHVTISPGYLITKLKTSPVFNEMR